MKILLDECVPKIVKKRLPQFDISTVQEMNWSGVKNGELIELAEINFDVFISSDQNLKHQQNLKSRTLAFIILPSNQVPIVESLLPQIELALNEIQKNEFIEIPLA
jgi:hypothetical protein